MKLRNTLFLIISGIFIPINAANATENDIHSYYFYTGSLGSICSAYAIDAISEKDASMMLNSLVDMGNESINDSNTKKRFNNFVKNSKTFTKEGCSKLVK